jgi:gliding motility-associated-like protein
LKKLLFIFFFFAIAGTGYASHNRAGEITYRHISGFTYEITIKTYTKLSSAAAANGSVDRPSLDSVHVGEGIIRVFTRTAYYDDSQADIRTNYYVLQHTYIGAGIDTIWFIDPNRNGNVINVPNSFYTPFAIYTVLRVGFPGLFDDSPILLNPPIDSGCVGVPFIHNPAASDPNHDSLSYELIHCKGEGNPFPQPIPGYSYPFATDSFTLNPVTGDLVWASPDSAGEYNVAFLIISWHKFGNNWFRVGEIERDMQIRILHCPQSFQAPIINPVADTCILAGDTLEFSVTAFDPNHEIVSLNAISSILPSPAQFTVDSVPLNDTLTGVFNWATNCNNIAGQPYQIVFRANDHNPTINLVTYESMMVTVIGPPVTGLTAEPNGNTMMLHWNPNECSNIDHYNIYHRSGSFPGTIECPCQTGVPAYTGYSLIGTTTDTTFTDSNNGAGLAIGISHCYMVTAVYEDSSESCASAQICNQLKKDLPVITHVSVVTTAQSGSDTVIWSKATEIDTVVFPRPYAYKVLRSDGDFFGTIWHQVNTVTLNENDTIFLDNNNLDTRVVNSYKIDLYYDSDNDNVADALKGSSQTASSVFLTLAPSDESMVLTWQENVPWSNIVYTIYRQNGAAWDSIGSTLLQTYTDDSLVNGTEYCYYVRSAGTYGTQNIIDPIINLSQRVCAIAIDNVPPCPPAFSVNSDCVENVNYLNWNNPNNSCADDVWHYKIYFAGDGVNFDVIDTSHFANDTTFVHDNPSLSGCYKVTAVDSNLNESAATPVCVDTCRQYVLPSAFTPNGDQHNDFFHPCDSTTSEELQEKNCPPYKNVKDIDMKIYNRWGNLVFETNDKDVNWDGKNKYSKGECPDGVYYYTCVVNFYRLNGTESKNLNGYIHLIRGK